MVFELPAFFYYTLLIGFHLLLSLMYILNNIQIQRSCSHFSFLEIFVLCGLFIPERNPHGRKHLYVIKLVSNLSRPYSPTLDQVDWLVPT